MLVEFGRIPLKVSTQKARAYWVVDVGHEAHMEEARHGLLKSGHTRDEDLLLHQKVEDHFPVKKKEKFLQNFILKLIIKHFGRIKFQNKPEMQIWTRNTVTLGPLYPGSGIGKLRIPNPGKPTKFYNSDRF